MRAPSFLVRFCRFLENDTARFLVMIAGIVLGDVATYFVAPSLDSSLGGILVVLILVMIWVWWGSARRRYQ